MEADLILSVWHGFTDWIKDWFQPEDVDIIVALNCETCGLTWLWRLTQPPYSILSFSAKMKYFLGPLKVIREYTHCPLHTSKNKLETLELVCV
jgi:hypothetical protein